VTGPRRAGAALVLSLGVYLTPLVGPHAAALLGERPLDRRVGHDDALDRLDAGRGLRAARRRRHRGLPPIPAALRPRSCVAFASPGRFVYSDLDGVNGLAAQ
jgi:hypothetical protein